MGFDPGDDFEDRQLALIREQRPIVAALRLVGYHIEFLFSPPPGQIPAEACAMLERFLETPLSLETKLIISDLLESAGRSGHGDFGSPAGRDARDR